jgi:hypothetical protein
MASSIRLVMDAGDTLEYVDQLMSHNGFTRVEVSEVGELSWAATYQKQVRKSRTEGMLDGITAYQGGPIRGRYNVITVVVQLRSVSSTQTDVVSEDTVIQALRG